MKNEPKHSRYGTSMSEWILLTPQRLTDNGSGLWDIVPQIKNFSLQGDDRFDFVHRTILALIDKGGRPVVASQTQPIWEETFKYGTKPEEIADNVISEWVAEGAPDRVEWGHWWFAYPNSHR
jgi:hypothetical protein